MPSWQPIRLDGSAVLPLLQVTVGELAPLALVMGDQARVERVAELLQDVRQLGRNREYLTVTGTWNGVPVTVASHGVGSAGAGVCIEELLRGGVRRLIRCGTAGGLQPEVGDGDIVVATAAIRDDGLTERLVPAAFPAVADAAVQQHLLAAAQAHGSERVHSGVVLTSDVFYPGPSGSPLAGWAAAGAVAVEMELSVVLVLAALHGAQAGGIFAIDGNPLAAGDESMSDYDPHRDVVTAASLACARAGLDALTTR